MLKRLARARHCSLFFHSLKNDKKSLIALRHSGCHRLAGLLADLDGPLHLLDVLEVLDVHHVNVIHTNITNIDNHYLIRNYLQKILNAKQRGLGLVDQETTK
jgi:hypothetical protein